MGDTESRADVIREVIAEMDRTDQNIAHPGRADYIQDVIRRLDHLLPGEYRNFEH